METATNDAWERKARSERRLAARDVLVNPHLPTIENVEEATIRPPRVVAERALALFAVILHIKSPQGQQAHYFLRKARLWAAITPEERAFLLKNVPHEEELSQFSWRSEALWVLLWALQLIPELGYPESPCEIQVIDDLVLSRTSEKFVSEARIRSAAQILDEVDFIYRCHWAVVEAGLHGQAPSGNIDPDVVYEWHYALNWLIGYLDQDWDDVSTDT